MRVLGTQDSVILQDQYRLNGVLGFNSLIEEVEFSDGTEWDYTKLAQHYISLATTNGADVIYGFDISNTFEGGLGDDRIEGMGGADTYIYNIGDGNDVLFDSWHSGDSYLIGTPTDPGGDRLILRDIALSDVDFGRFGEDLYITIRSTGDTITLEGQYSRKDAQEQAIETIQFSDRSVDFRDLNPEDVDLVGTAASETLTGTNFGEVIDGRGGDDTLIGLSDGDTYLFDVGYGNDTIIDRQERLFWSGRNFAREVETDDRVLFGDDINIDNVVFTKDGDDLLISIVDRTDTLRIKNQFRSIEDQVEWFEFQDGTRWHIRDIEERLAIVGGSRGDDVIQGVEDQPNVLDGREGDDQLIGGRAGDTYAFGGQYDLDEIVESTTPFAGAIDRVVFGVTVTPDSVRFLRDGNDLIVDLGNGLDRLTITEGFSTRQVEEFWFADGTILDLESVRNRLLTGTRDDDVLLGFDNRNDTLDGGEGSDALEGGKGNDTYKFDLGYGADSILDTGGVDRIVFGEAISSAMLEFSNEGGDLLIRFKGASDSLIVLGGASRTSSIQRVETLEFADGSVLAIEEILQQLVRQQATDGSDVIDARTGVPITVTGGLNDDLIIADNKTTMLFRVGDGSDVVDARYGIAGSQLIFVDLTSDEAVIRRPDLSSGDLIIAFSDSGDQVLVRGVLTGSNVPQISFADNVSWNRDQLIEAAIRGQSTERSDFIRGSYGNDTITPGLGDDDVDGGVGNDTYVFRRGDGRDVISDSSGADSLQILGYRSEDVQVARPVADRDELVLSFDGSNDDIVLRFASATSGGIESIVFGDGTTWTREEMFASAVGRGTPFNDTIVGTDLADTINGGLGNDVLSGMLGKDTYVYARGDGRDIIDDQGYYRESNTLAISDYVSADARIVRHEDRPNDLILRFADGDEIVIIDGLRSYSARVTEFTFQDGERLTLADIIARYLTGQQTDGDDRLFGTDAADELEGVSGNDWISGGYGSDTYVFRRGDGQDVIADNGYESMDVLRIEGYSPSEISIERSSTDIDSIVISFVGTDDEIAVWNTLYGSDADQIEAIEIVDASSVVTTWTIAEVKTNLIAIQQTDGDDRITGTNASEELVGGPGDDWISGRDGSDTYVFRRGDGRDAISDDGEYGTDVLRILGYNVEDVQFSRSPAAASNLVVTFTGTDDRIEVASALNSSYANEIEQFEIVDTAGMTTTLTIKALKALLVGASQTDGADRIIGFDGADEIIGGLGEDYLSGGDGSDIYVFNRGDGLDVIDDNGQYGTDVLEIRGYGRDEIIFTRHAARSDWLEVTFTTSDDRIVVRNTLYGDYTDQIELIRFSDGTPDLTIANLVAQVADANITTVTGTTGSDSFVSTSADEFFSDVRGVDTYTYARGGGHDVINDTYRFESSTDTLHLIGITPGDVTVEGVGNDVVLYIAASAPGAGDEGSITILSGLSNTDGIGVEGITFDDGSPAWNREALRNLAIAHLSTDGDDYIAGTGWFEEFNAGPGDDVLIGNAGSDTYIYHRGDGSDIIDDSYRFNGTDTLILYGIAPDDVSVSLSGNNAILAVSESSPGAGDGAAITLIDEMVETDAIGVEFVTFADFAATWTQAEIAQRAVLSAKTDGDDVIVGGGHDEVYEGGLGNDSLCGSGGSDIYRFARGDGRDTIEDDGFGDTDVIEVSGYSADEIEFVRSVIFADALELRFAGTDDLITVLNTLDSSLYDQIERIDLVDETGSVTATWTIGQIKYLLLEESTDGDDRIVGFDTADSLSGGRGDDVLLGGAGLDTYVYARGDGYDLVIDTPYENGDVLQLVGISPDDVRLERGVGNDLEVVVLETSPGAGDAGRITLRYSYLSTNSYGVERIVFDDATEWLRADFETLAARNVATDDADQLIGTSGADVLEGLGGDDELKGGAGDDTYLFHRGDGADVIRDAGSGFDTIEISGYAADEITFTRRGQDGADLIIRLADGDEITVVNGLTTRSADRIERVVLSDSSAEFLIADIETNLVLGASSDLDDQIVGTDLADTLNAGKGNDLVVGLGGTDTYIYAAGDGDDRFVDESYSVGDRVVLTDINSADVVWARRSPADGDDLVLRFAGVNDRLLIGDSLSGTAYGIETIEFADGIVWTVTQMREAVLKSAKTDSAENIRGFDGVDILEGGKGDESLSGGDGDDIYRFAAGDGHDVIDDAATSTGDRLEILNLSSLEATASRLFKGSSSIILSFATTDDTITIKDALSETGSGIEQILFSDGVTWTGADLLSALDNKAPVANGDGIFTVRQGEPLRIDPAGLLRNDYDPDGDPLTILAVESSEGVSAQIDADGMIVVTSKDGFLGSTNFTYILSDGRNGFSEASVDIRVTPIAVAKDDSGFSVNEDGFITIRTERLLSNDVDGDRLIVSQVFDAVNGSVSLASNGSISFTPTADFHGLASFRYVANSPEGGRAEATVFVDVLAVNDAPVAVTDSAIATLAENDETTFAASLLLANDIEVDGDPLTVTGVQGDANLTVTLSADGQVKVVPTQYFFGTASFTYTVSDPAGATAIGTATVEVTPVNNAPITAADSATINEDEPRLFTAAELLANDSDPDFDLMTITSVRAIYGGTVELAANQTVLFTPWSNYFGQAQFIYEVSDGQGGLSEARVDVQVDPVNDAPTARADKYDTALVGPLVGTEDVALTIPIATLISNDSDVDGLYLTLETVSYSEHGTVAFNVAEFVHEEASVTALGEGYSHSLRMADGSVLPAWLSIDAVTGRISGTPPINLIATIDVEIVSTDVDANEVVNPAELDVNGNAGATITFTPDADYWGEAEFQYVVSDEGGLTDNALVTLYFAPVGDAPPVAGNDSITGYEDVELVIPSSVLLANDGDIDRDPLRIESISMDPLFGTIWMDGDGFIHVQPPLNRNGSIFFNYVVTDDADGTDTGTVTINLIAVNDAPTAAPDLATTSLDAPLVLRISDLMANDSDVDLRPDQYDLLQFIGVNQPVDGTAWIYNDEFIVVEYATGYSGPTSVEYTIADPEGVEDDGTVTVVIGDTHADTITGSDRRDLLIGTDGVETIVGGLGDDDIYAEAGDDIIAGGEGADRIYGGDGIDTVTFTNSNIGVVVDLQSLIGQGGEAQGDIFFGIENISGSGYSDTLRGDAGVNVLTGLGGGDVLLGRGGDDGLFGGLGNDTLEGGAGADTLDGGQGVDTADYSASDDAVAVDLATGAGSAGEAAGDQLSGIEMLVGSSYVDQFSGSAADETFDGRFGDDLLAGRAGSDTYLFGFDSGNDTVAELGEATDIDRIAFGPSISAKDVSFSQDGNDLVVELEHDDGLLIDTLRVSDHVLGRETGIEEVVFADGTVWDRDTIDTFIRAGSFNAADDVVRFADEDIEFLITADRLLLNDASEGVDLLHIVSVGNAQNGSVRIDANGDVMFTSDQDFNGDAFFDYTVEDQFGRQSTARAEVNVLPVNDAPIGQDDSGFVGIEDTVLVISWDDLLANDIDVDVASNGDELGIVGFGPLLDVNGDSLRGGSENATYGNVQINSFARTITFDPIPDHYGFAGFTYTVADLEGATSTANVEVSFVGVNDAPDAGKDRASVRLTQTKSLDVDVLLSNDTDPEGDEITFLGATGPGVEVHADGTIRLTPTPNSNGPHQYTYTITDGSGVPVQGRFTLNVLPVDDAPIGNDDHVDGVEDTVVVIPASSLIANDRELDGEHIGLTSVGNAVGGTVMLDGVGNVIFTPDQNVNGVVSFDYVVTDVVGRTDTATVRITLAPVNDAPVIAELAPLTGTEDVAFAAQLSANAFSDIDGDDLTYAVTQANGDPLPGWLAFDTATLGLSGTPPQDFNGTLDLIVTASDGEASTDRAFEVAIAAVNDAPVARDDGVFTVYQPQPITITSTALLANDTDADTTDYWPQADTLKLVGVAGATHGTVTLDQTTGNVTYTPFDGYVGADQFIYTVSDFNTTDGSGGDAKSTSQATVYLNVSDAYAGYNQGSEGNDNHSAGFGRSYFGGDGDDQITGGLFGGSYAGGAGNDRLVGLLGRNTLDGNEGDDRIIGGLGADTISGGTGNDLLTGGLGRDTFIFRTGDGSDTITDFSNGFRLFGRTFNNDTISIDVDGVGSFADLMGLASQENGGVLFAFGNGDQLFLEGTLLAALDDDSFTFV